MLENKYAVLAKAESVYGTDPTPSVGNDLIYTSPPSVEPVTRTIERKQPMSSYGAVSRLNIGEAVKVSFGVEMVGDWSLTSDTPPRLGALLRACNFTQTINSGTSIVYQNNSSQNGESVTLYVYKDGIRRIITGARGNVRVVGKAGDIPMLEFELTGIYASGYATDQSFPSITTSLSSPCICAYGEVEVGAYTSPVIENFALDMGNVISKRPDLNDAGGIDSWFISNSKPTLEIDPEVVALSSFNPHTLWEGNTLVDNQIIFKLGGADAATQKCTLAVNDMQYDEIPDGGGRENIQTYALKLSAGAETDVSLTFVGG